MDHPLFYYALVIMAQAIYSDELGKEDVAGALDNLLKTIIVPLCAGFASKHWDADVSGDEAIKMDLPAGLSDSACEHSFSTLERLPSLLQDPGQLLQGHGPQGHLPFPLAAQISEAAQ